IERVGKNQTARYEPGDRSDAGLIGDIAGRKNESGFLAVEIRKLVLQFYEGMICSGNVPGAARAGAHAGGGFNHSPDHCWVLPHAEVVIGAPDHDITWPVRRMPMSVRKPPCYALQIGEHPISALSLERFNGAPEVCLIVHDALSDQLDALRNQWL